MRSPLAIVVVDAGDARDAIVFCGCGTGNRNAARAGALHVPRCAPLRGKAGHQQRRAIVDSISGSTCSTGAGPADADEIEPTAQARR